MQSNFWCLILLLVFTVNSTLPLNLIICFFKFNFKNRIYIITLFQLKAICTCTPDSAKSRGHNSLRVQIRMHCYSLQWVGESVQSHWQTQVRNSGDFRANCTKLEFHVKSSKCSFSHEFHENKEHFMLSCFMVKWFGKMKRQYNIKLYILSVKFTLHEILVIFFFHVLFDC